jgi:hypothetical protein
MSRPQIFGSKSERAIAYLLRRTYGRRVVTMDQKGPFDLLVDGWRVELKAANRTEQAGQPRWMFNIHRHGVLEETTDFYVLRLEDVPYSKYAIHLLYRAPIGVTVINVSMRNLLNGTSMRAEEFYRFARGEFGKREIAA